MRTLNEDLKDEITKVPGLSKSQLKKIDEIIDGLIGNH